VKDKAKGKIEQQVKSEEQGKNEVQGRIEKLVRSHKRAARQKAKPRVGLQALWGCSLLPFDFCVLPFDFALPAVL
jgi:hypothetical protein